MRIDFRQGIITYPIAGTTQAFLSASGEYVSLQSANGRTDVAFAHGSENYLLSETSDAPNVWGPLPSNTDCWLYWDIDLRTGVRTFGFTTLQPITSGQQPSPVTNQHWFDTTTNTMKVVVGGQFRIVARVFAAKVANGTFASVATGVGSRVFAGTQVGITTPDVRIGQILFDDNGSPIRRVDGRLFTTEHEVFIDGSAVNTVKLDAAIIPATAVGVLPKFHVVKFTDFGKINLAGYADIQESSIAMLTEDLTADQTGVVVVQGYITNPGWNWATVGAPLWIDGTGRLVDVDPHLSNPQAYPTAKPPIARVFARDSVIFDQGLGGIGPRGLTGYAANAVSRAGDTMTGALILNANPIVALGAATKQYVDTSAATSSVVIANATGTITLDASKNMFKITQTGAITYAFSNVPLATAITIIVVRSGIFAETWPTNVIWQDGVTPAASSVLGLTDIYTLITVDSGTPWIAAPFALGVS